MRRLFYWKKVAEALFSRRQLCFRWQKAWLLPAASCLEKVAEALFRDVSFVSAGKRRGFCQLQRAWKKSPRRFFEISAWLPLAKGVAVFPARQLFQVLHRFECARSKLRCRVLERGFFSPGNEKNPAFAVWRPTHPKNPRRSAGAGAGGNARVPVFFIAVFSIVLSS